MTDKTTADIAKELFEVAIDSMYGRDESPAAVKARVMARRKDIEVRNAGGATLTESMMQAQKYAEDMRETALMPDDSADRFIASCNPNYSSTVCAP
jgi:hypothetical protein